MFQWPDVVCPNGHKTKPDMSVDQTKQKCTTCGKNYGVTAFGQTIDVDLMENLFREMFPAE